MSNTNNNNRYHVWYLNGKRRVVDLHLLKHFYATVSKENPYYDGSKSYNTYPYHAEAHLVNLTDAEVKEANSFYNKEESEVEATEFNLNYLVLRAQRGSMRAQNQIIEYFKPLFEKAAPLPKRLKNNKIDDYWVDEYVHESVNHLIRLIHQHDFSGHFKPRVMAEIRYRYKDLINKERKRLDSSINPATLSLDKKLEDNEGVSYNSHILLEGESVDFDSKIDVDLVLKDLSKEDKTILKLYHIKGMTLEEISLMYKTNKMNISRRLSKSLKLLRKRNN